MISYLVPVTFFFTGINIFKNKNFFLIVENIFFVVFYLFFGTIFFSYYYENSFDLYINGIYISDAGPKEYEVINKIIRENVSKINNTISLILENLKLEMKDCFVMGFSQGGIMAFELGRSIKSQLGGVGIISSRIMQKDETPNSIFQQTPIFISHGAQDDVLPISNFNQSIDILKKDNYNFESHLIEKDTHTMSPDTIKLFQDFIKKNI